MTLKKRVLQALAGVMLLLLMLLGNSGAALAHDDFTGTSPVDGSTVDSVPEKVEITMTNTPATVGSVIEVLDESGTNWATGSVDVLDRVASTAVKPGAPAGRYTVKWRLVSSDSHPIEGDFTFTATTGGTGQAVGAGPIVSVQAQPETAPEQVQDSGTVPWSVIGLIAVLVGVVAAMVVVARKRLAQDD